MLKEIVRSIRPVTLLFWLSLLFISTILAFTSTMPKVHANSGIMLVFALFIQLELALMLAGIAALWRIYRGKGSETKFDVEIKFDVAAILLGDFMLRIPWIVSRYEECQKQIQDEREKEDVKRTRSDVFGGIRKLTDLIGQIEGIVQDPKAKHNLLHFYVRVDSLLETCTQTISAIAEGIRFLFSSGAAQATLSADITRWAYLLPKLLLNYVQYKSFFCFLYHTVDRQGRHAVLTDPNTSADARILIKTWLGVSETMDCCSVNEEFQGWVTIPISEMNDAIDKQDSRLRIKKMFACLGYNISLDSLKK